MTRIKLCGLQRAEDVIAANEIHPEYGIIRIIKISVIVKVLGKVF